MKKFFFGVGIPFFRTKIDEQEKLAREFGLDPNQVIHHRVGNLPAAAQAALGRVKPVALARKIGNGAPVFGRPDVDHPGVYQAPHLVSQADSEQPAQSQVEQHPANQPPPDPPASPRNPFAGKNVRIAGKS